MSDLEYAKEKDWREYIKQAQNGDKAALEQLVMENTGLIHMVLKRFVNYGNDMEELFQVGAIGLMRAIERFDLTTEYAFSTYAVPMIIGEIQRFLRDDGMIHVGRRLKENARKIQAVKARMNQRENRDPTLQEIMETTGLSQEEIVMALDSMVVVESIHRPIAKGDSGSTQTLEDQLEDEESSDARMIDRITVQNMLEDLPEKERKLILLRYMEGRTQTEVARILGMNQVAVSRMEKKILQRLRSKF